MSSNALEVRDELLRAPHRDRVSRYAAMLLPPGSWSDLHTNSGTNAPARGPADHAMQRNTDGAPRFSRVEAGAGVASSIAAGNGGETSVRASVGPERYSTKTTKAAGAETPSGLLTTP